MHFGCYLAIHWYCIPRQRVENICLCFWMSSLLSYPCQNRNLGPSDIFTENQIHTLTLHCNSLFLFCFAKFTFSCAPYSETPWQRPSRWSRQRRRCWSRERGRRVHQERRASPPGPSWCSSQILERHTFILLRKSYNSPMIVSSPKKMLTTAMSSSQAL